ncbi:profilin-like [Mizuhopecten yessoensis]|uniref:Profilin n=1 Tax=Mizuhopecten yessoensis TaxID=6573 RepID=A0A210PQL7_MIZYE|nr:profilin-like [Mizuhopecten yessoensis]XP_021377667.1 profilin-like [Mizuhopecten yessoensis]OWF38799.1 Profilin [Mizuhopecten yessoensis]
MSWDSYIDNLLAQSKDSSGAAHADNACIIGLDGGSPWTTSGHAAAFKLDPEEGVKIAKCFKSKDFSGFMSSGIHCGKEKYQFLRVEDEKLVLGKKKDKGAITMQASKTAIVIAHCPEGGQQGVTNKAVAVIAEYLESLGM